MSEDPKAIRVKTPIVWRDAVWHRFVEATMAVLLFYAIIQFSDRIDQRSRSQVPASSWFKVNEIYVPDHEKDSNPPVIFDRQVLENFRGFYVIEVQQKIENGLWWSSCSGSGVSDYEKQGPVAPHTIDWEAFISRPCHVAPGIYRLRVSWEMKRPDWPIKSVVSLSNEFLVVEPGAATNLPTPATDDKPASPVYERIEGN